ncbi:hypothetical protein A1O3_09268 [Capronia epimyces CBS 606.96]|uniref:Secreted protein n=1 Tax=Capronia epimyces CBS 606.96 TaxID=1182542 RepID=W9XC93_9EURO|nr:uncharacterized protein A1O3_09268 [Capronia epimyces CBS 606.96]EXJ78107.1 hypothetical protein A1O3_09268 [Capronia epimyces CBS 606.96]
MADQNYPPPPPASYPTQPPPQPDMSSSAQQNQGEYHPQQSSLPEYQPQDTLAQLPADNAHLPPQTATQWPVQSTTAATQAPSLATQGYDSLPPPLPQRPGTLGVDVKEPTTTNIQQPPQYQTDYAGQPAQQPPKIHPAQYAGPSSFQPGSQSIFQPPPQRHKQTFADDDNPSNPVHYIRDPHKLIGYLVPFPRPNLPNVKPEDIPVRFIIYTPPPPPLQKPAEGQKEGKLHKVQRKWQEEVRSAKTSTAKTASWKGVKSKATKGINWAMNKTTSSNLDFLGRVSPAHSDDDGEGHETHKTVGVDEMVLVYPPSLPLNEQQMREEFVNTMLRTKSKAQRDTIIATGLMPVGYGIDILATFIWPFGGLGEIDTVWAYASFRGAKTARSVTKRLSSNSETGNHEKDQLTLTFTHSARIEALKRYLDAECHKVDGKLFPAYVSSPTESDVLEAIGWTPRDRGGADQEEKNWEDEQWEMAEVKDDLKSVFSKGAREWRKWCLLLEKNPEKAMKK